VAVDNRPVRHPRCIIIAGPNGSGKTTFAKEYLLRETDVVHFVNADLIAGGLSPLRPELATRQAGRLVLRELARLVGVRKNFAFESTLSGRTYLGLLKKWKSSGYRIEIVFLSLPSVHLALQRIASRVRQGGHTVPRADVIRRFERSSKNFHALYRPLADGWAIYDNSGSVPRLLERVI
jgi:predicted ABC-type ATPase